MNWLLPQFIGEDGHFSTIFDFSTHNLSDGEHGWYDALPMDFKRWRKTVIDSQLEVQGCGLEANIIENHDEPRGASRYLPEHARNSAGIKMLGTVSVLLRGIPFIYQGQEIGMQNVVWNSIEEYDDISTIDQYHIARQAGLSDAQALKVCGRMSRDNARTPMQWSDGEHAGFTKGTPWLKVNANYKEINVRSQEQDADSVLNYYRRLVELRKNAEYKEVFVYGQFIPVYEDTESVMAFYRVDENKRMLIAANFGEEAVTVELEYPVKQIALSNSKRILEDGADALMHTLLLERCEVVVLELG